MIKRLFQVVLWLPTVFFCIPIAGVLSVAYPFIAIFEWIATGNSLDKEAYFDMVFEVSLLPLKKLMGE